MKDISEYSKSNRRIVFILMAFFMAAYIAHAIYQEKQAEEMSLNFSIEGKVQHVYSGEKGLPVVTINSKVYYIYVLALRNEIQVGDSLNKQKGSNVYRLIKKGSGIVKDYNW